MGEENNQVKIVALDTAYDSTCYEVSWPCRSFLGLFGNTDGEFYAWMKIKDLTPGMKLDMGGCSELPEEKIAVIGTNKSLKLAIEIESKMYRTSLIGTRGFPPPVAPGGSSGGGEDTGFPKIRS